jgi:small subunit ribosomal protein S7
MPRKAHIVRREILPDPVYASTLVSKFVNQMMWDGKRSVSQQIFYRALNIVGEKSGDDPLKVFKKAVENVKPILEVKSRRVGGSTYQVPMEVGAVRRTSLSIRWLIGYSRSRGEKSMEEKLAAELLEAANNRGNAVRKKEDTHRMAEANKAFAHYRW